MDALYEVYGEDDDSEAISELPIELKSLWSGSERVVLEQVFAAAELDRNRMLSQIGFDLAEAFGRAGSPFRPEKKKTRDVWKTVLHLKPRRGALRQGPIYLSAWMGTAVGIGQVIDCYVWIKGGRSSSRIFEDALIGAQNGSTFPDAGWDNGVAVLSRTKLTEFSSPGSFAVDLDRICLKLRGDFAKQNNAALAKLLDMLRDH